MRILLVGSGGRENAIAWKIASSDSFCSAGSKLFCAPGNPGIAQYAECINIKADDVDELLSFAVNEKIDLTVVGPEIPLSLGIGDKFRAKGLKIFGPDRSAAEIESSKLFAKQLMSSYNIPTASYKSFSRNEKDKAFEFISGSQLPLVFKADGLAAGKGVIISNTLEEATEALNTMCSDDAFGDASENFVIEEFLQGEEVSVFCITDGDDFVLLPFSRDHKKIGEGETGKNTGGMGAVSPVKKFMKKDVSDKIVAKIIVPVLSAMKKEGRQFSGCLYCGLIFCNDEPYVIEFNCRFGDPETQSVLPLISSDFLEMLLASSEGKIRNYELSMNNMYSCCVVLASGGYPDKFQKGFAIEGVDDAEKSAIVFHSGTDVRDGKLFTAGGRVLSVVGLSLDSLREAMSNAYDAISKISYYGVTCRKDIGKQFIEKGDVS
jgi:phosphoribosylamine--glycine ligase